jgi:predicted O-linked N-acetylglucosamine transferase (SPINDLY family)
LSFKFIVFLTNVKDFLERDVLDFERSKKMKKIIRSSAALFDVSSNLKGMIFAADAHRNAARWHEAIQVYLQINQAIPQTASIKQNLALCYFGLADFNLSKQLCNEVILLDPTLWKAHILLAKCYRKTAEPLRAEAEFKLVLLQDAQNGEALLGLADLALNEFGDPRGAIEWVRPLMSDTAYCDDAQLTYLMASLYDRDILASHLNQEIISFSKATLQMSASEIPRYHYTSNAKRPIRLRVGLLSPLFSASPVYFLTIAFFRALASQSDLVFLNRGTQADWATAEFKALTTEWHNLSALSATELARFLHAQLLDVIYDLGGWMDPIALKALSTKPVRRQLKWVGGQSVTTGLDCFDGWIGDHWQSPLASQGLYTEPLMNAVDDYAKYTPPPYLPKPASSKSDVLAIFANPAKVSQAFLEKISMMAGKKCCIHRQYQYGQVQVRIESVLKSGEVEYLCPGTHLEALEAVNRHAVILDTFPYSSGLTAREAMAMGSQIKVLSVGSLFCERHTARYQS